MKKSRTAVILAIAFIATILCAAPSFAAKARIEAFVRSGCVHCDRAKEFLSVLKAEEPGLEIATYDVMADKDAAERLLRIMRDSGVEQGAVPAFYINGKLLIGFDDAQTTGRIIRSLAAGNAYASYNTKKRIVNVPLFGAISTDDYGLVLFTVIIGLIDGFNPCAMWVLLFLLSMLVNVRDRRKMAAIAGIFVFASGAVYFMFMAAWLNFFFLAGITRAVQVVLALVALVVAAINIKDFFALGRGVSLSIPEGMKSRVGKMIRDIVRAENLAGAIAGTCVLAVLVNFVELMCTAGLPALYTEVLASHEMSRIEYYGYLALYNAAYIFDDSVVVFTAVFGFTRYRVHEGAGRVLKLISGFVIAILGFLLLFKPEWLSFF